MSCSIPAPWLRRGRHWLDVVRYADSDGYEYDALRPNSWRYREYVTRAFNQDKPYDRFIREQLAGDELPDRDYDSLTAFGFCRNGPFIGDMVLMQNELTGSDELDDVVTGTSAASRCDGGLCALPRSQVRSDSTKGPLPDGSCLLPKRKKGPAAGAAIPG